jgi:hypothetical protein
MTLADFKKTIELNKLPDNISVFLQALWFDAKGDWNSAHNIAQKDEGNLLYDRIHAYLHRKEGDIFNAKWWYRRINVPFPNISLEAEWEYLVEEYLLK